MTKRIWYLGGWLAMATCFCGVLHAAPPPAQIRVVFSEKLGPLHMERMALGQGGLSEEPMFADRVTELRALCPGVIRLFVQEYYNLLPERGRYHFDTLDRMVDSILKTGAKPLVCLCFKPRVLFPEIDDNIVEPKDYVAWEELVFQVVKVHGFATHDRQLQMHNVLLWNFSGEPAQVALSLEALPKEMRARHIILDALGAGGEENQRLRPEPLQMWKAGDQKLSLKLEPWAVHYWSLE